MKEKEIIRLQNKIEKIETESDKLRAKLEKQATKKPVTKKPAARKTVAKKSVDEKA